MRSKTDGDTGNAGSAKQGSYRNAKFTQHQQNGHYRDQHIQRIAHDP
jgi:hypothetical protein